LRNNLRQPRASYDILARRNAVARDLMGSPGGRPLEFPYHREFNRTFPPARASTARSALWLLCRAVAGRGRGTDQVGLRRRVPLRDFLHDGSWSLHFAVELAGPDSRNFGDWRRPPAGSPPDRLGRVGRVS